MSLERSLHHDLEAASSDARPDGGEKIAPLKLGDGSTNDPGDDASPARMNGNDVSAVRVGNEDRNAVGHAYADGPWSACRPTHDGVGLGLRAHLAHLARVDRTTAVDLLYLDYSRHAECARDGVCALASFGEAVSEPCVIEQCRSQYPHRRP
jgi:hypothetical protein